MQSKQVNKTIYYKLLFLNKYKIIQFGIKYNEYNILKKILYKKFRNIALINLNNIKVTSVLLIFFFFFFAFQLFDSAIISANI